MLPDDAPLVKLPYVYQFYPDSIDLGYIYTTILFIIQKLVISKGPPNNGMVADPKCGTF
jgi:hypothetical protein